MTLYFDKLIDRYIPTDSGWNFHPDNTATLTAVMEEGVIDKLVIDQANPLPHEYKQLMYSNISGSGNASVYYLDMITSKDSGTLPTIERDLAASNAKAIKLAPNTTMIFRTNYPYNKDRLKKVLCRCRKAAADTELTLHVGVIGIEDKAYKQPDGNYGNTSFYEVAVSGEVTDSYVTYVGYVLGTDSVEGIETALLSHPRPNNDPDYPAKLLDGTTDIALMIKTGAGGAGENEFIYVDSIELQDTENALTELPKGALVVNTIEGMADDDKLTPVEKNYLVTLLSEIDAEYGEEDGDPVVGLYYAGVQAGVSAVKLLELKTAYDALHSYLDPFLVDLTKIDTIVGTTFDTLFDTYYAKRTMIEQEISRLGSAVLSLNVDTTVINVSARGVLETPTITFSLVLYNIAASAVVMSRSDGGSLTKVNDTTYTLDCSTVMIDSIQVIANATYLDKGYSAFVNITKVIGTAYTPVNLGSVSSVVSIPNVLPDGTALREGDYFLWASTDVAAAPPMPALKMGSLYVRTASNTWRAEGPGDEKLVMSMFKEYADLPNTEDTSVIGFAVIKKLVAINAFIENLNAKNITAGTGDGSTGGFRFRAKSKTNLELPYDASTNPSVFDVMYNDRKVFEVDPESGNIMFGNYNPSTKSGGILYDYVNDKLLGNVAYDQWDLVIESNADFALLGAGDYTEYKRVLVTAGNFTITQAIQLDSHYVEVFRGLGDSTKISMNYDMGNTPVFNGHVYLKEIGGFNLTITATQTGTAPILSLRSGNKIVENIKLISNAVTPISIKGMYVSSLAYAETITFQNCYVKGMALGYDLCGNLLYCTAENCTEGFNFCHTAVGCKAIDCINKGFYRSEGMAGCVATGNDYGLYECYEMGGCLTYGNVTANKYRGYEFAELRATTIALATGNLVKDASAGYTYLPNGMIMQWRKVTFPSDAVVNVGFPIAFPTVCVYAGVSSEALSTCKIVDRTKASVGTNAAADVWLFAIGW